MINKIKNYLMGYVNYIVYEPRFYCCDNNDIVSAIAGNYTHDNEKRTFFQSYIQILLVLIFLFCVFILLLLFLRFIVLAKIVLPTLFVLLFSSAMTFILRALTK